MFNSITRGYKNTRTAGHHDLTRIRRSSLAIFLGIYMYQADTETPCAAGRLANPHCRLVLACGAITRLRTRAELDECLDETFPEVEIYEKGTYDLPAVTSYVQTESNGLALVPVDAE